MQFIRKNQILISTIAAISVFCIVLFTRSIQSRIVHGKQGQIAIKTLDEVRRPFLSIHSAETALLKDGYRKTFRDDLEQGIVLGLRLISDFRVVAAYNPELLQRVEKLANTFDTWIKIERTFFNQSAWTASADIKPLSNVEKLDSITETAGCFSLTMDALGNVEIPIHRDIREGSRAVNEVVITGGGVIVLLISMLFLMMYYKNKTLRMMIIGRKNTENTLKQSERQLRTITENIPGIIWMSDPEISVINYISPGYKNIFGRTCESLYENPMSFLEAVHNDDREYILNALKKYEQGDYNVEYRIVKPDGSIRWIWAQSFPLRDEKGMIYSITGVAQDISERKQVEETISHLSKAVEQSPSIFMITDYNGNISFVNPRFTQLTGYTEEETIGQNPRFLQSGKTAFEEYKRLWEVISAGGTWKGEFHNKKKNGELYWESASISSMKNKDGVITHFIKAAEDITRRKQSEQKIIMLNETLEQRVKERSEKLITANRKIVESEMRFRSILSSLYEAAIIIYNRDGRIMALWGTPEMDKRYGVSAVEVIGRSIKDFLHPEHIEQELVNIRNVIDTGNKVVSEHMITVPNGNFWHEISLSPIRNDNGDINEAVGFIRDISERKLNEEKIRVKNSHLELLQFTAVSANEASEIKDAFLPVLEHICRYTGWEIGHVYVISKDNHDLLIPTEDWCFEGENRFSGFCKVTKKTEFLRGIGLPGRILASGKPHWITDVIEDNNFLRSEIAKELKIKSGIAFPVMIKTRVVAVLEFFTTMKVEPDQPFMGIMADVGTQLGRVIERKQAEEYLSLLSSAIMQSSEGLAVADIEGNLIFLNHAFASMHGYTEKELIGRHLSVFHTPDQMPAVNRANRELNKTGSFKGEIWHAHRNGTVFPALMYNSLLKSRDGDTIGVIGAVIDITERKKMEEALAQSEKMKAMGIMTAGVAHEFNNILAVISSNAQVLEESHRKNKELIGPLNTICRMADDGAEIVNRMYDFTNLRKDTSLYIKINLNDLITQVIRFTMPRWMEMAQASGIKYQIVRKGVKTLPFVLGNPSELREVILNIINNALDAMPEGGMITVKTRCIHSPADRAGSSVSGVKRNEKIVSKRRTRNSVHKSGFVEITFTDTGKGMSENVKKKIFDPFFTTRSPQGTGLGLSVSYGIITRHGGEIDVESELGKGCVISLRLPVTDKSIRQREISGKVGKTKTI